MIKKNRLVKILELISEYDIETQEAMQSYLLDCGINVTQATVSRDIKELKLEKVQTLDGKSKYALPYNSLQNQQFSDFFLNSIISVDYALNTVVLKCGIGMAQAACTTLDKIEISDIVGTLAGDDTIFVLMRNEESALEFNKLLQSQLKD